MCPMAKAIVKTVKPKASDTPARPMPTFGKAAASTALPQPPRTSQNVPTNSAASFFIGVSPFVSGFGETFYSEIDLRARIIWRMVGYWLNFKDGVVLLL